jgi:biotin carboxyl carrier protein
MATPVEAQVTGTVLEIERRPGEMLAEGDVIILLESMKMEIPVEAPCAGRLAEIRVEEGEIVEEGAILAVIE